MEEETGASGKEVVGTQELTMQKKNNQALGAQVYDSNNAQTSLDLLLAATSGDVGDVTGPMETAVVEVEELEVKKSVAT